MPALKTKGRGRPHRRAVRQVGQKAKEPRTHTTPGGNQTYSGDRGRHTGTIKDGEGHDALVSHSRRLLKKYPEIGQQEYIDRCRARWEDYGQPPQYYSSLEECLENPVMDCWDRFERGEVRGETGRSSSQTATPCTPAPVVLRLTAPASFLRYRSMPTTVAPGLTGRCTRHWPGSREWSPPSCRAQVDTGILSPALLQRVCFVAAMGPPGGGKSSLRARLARQRPVLSTGQKLRFQDCLPLGIWCRPWRWSRTSR